MRDCEKKKAGRGLDRVRGGNASQGSRVKQDGANIVLPNSPTRLADGLEPEVFYVDDSKESHDAPQISRAARLLVPPRHFTLGEVTSADSY